MIAAGCRRPDGLWVDYELKDFGSNVAFKGEALPSKGVGKKRGNAGFFQTIAFLLCNRKSFSFTLWNSFFAAKAKGRLERFHGPSVCSFFELYLSLLRKFPFFDSAVNYGFFSDVKPSGSRPARERLLNQ